VQLLARVRPAALLGLVMEDAKQPGADLCAPFETIQPIQEGEEDILHQIVGVLLTKPHAARRPVEPSRILVDDRLQRGRIAPAQPRKE